MTTVPIILLVEDDPEQALLFGQVLRASGYTVVTVTSAEDAQRKLATAPFALLLADWSLPGMPGDALIALAKVHYPAMATILFSNHANVNIAAEAVGADAWYRKIEGIAPLRLIIKKLLSRGTNHA